MTSATRTRAPSSVTQTVWAAARQVAARVWGGGRMVAERWSHPRRHRKAVELLASPPAISRVVILCLGNICRSPYAAAALDRRLASLGRTEITVTSAGFLGGDRPAPEEACHAAEQRGVALTEHRSRLVTPALLAEADLLVAMEPWLIRDCRLLCGRLPRSVVLGDLDPDSRAPRSIRDPYGRPLDAFLETYARIDRCVEVLATYLRVPEDP